MGGGAFAQVFAQGEPTLNVRRLSPKEYEHLKHLYLKKLQDYFPNGYVVSLVEAPEKVDYGDVDFLVSLAAQADFMDMANHLGAAGVIYHSSVKSRNCTLGVPIDGSASTQTAVVYRPVYQNSYGSSTVRSGAPLTIEEYAQIDIELVPPELQDWHLFYSSYGDMLGLLGHIVHNLGFTVSDRGFWLRMKELDYSKTGKHLNVAGSEGIVFLSSDPKQVMRFLGLSVGRYNAGFDTVDELFEWLGACRLLSAEAIKIKRDNAHERTREQKRIVFTKFFSNWLPAHMDMNLEQDQQAQSEKLLHLRQGYLEDAITFFDRSQEYETKHDALVRGINNATAVELLKPVIANYSLQDGKRLNETVRAFRRHVGFEGSGPRIIQMPHSDVDSQLHRLLGSDNTSLRDPHATTEWVRDNWAELRSLLRQSTKAGSVAKEWDDRN